MRILVDKDLIKAKKWNFLSHEWPRNAKIHQFTCHACGRRHEVKEAALAISALDGEMTMQVTDEDWLAPCQCGRQVLEKMMFMKRYFIDEVIMERNATAPVKKKKTLTVEPWCFRPEDCAYIKAK